MQSKRSQKEFVKKPCPFAFHLGRHSTSIRASLADYKNFCTVWKMNIDFYLLGCVCFGFKLISEILFRKIGCLVGSENWVKLKMFLVLTVKQEQWGRKYLLSLFSLQIISGDAQRKKGLTNAQTRKHIEREKAQARAHPQNPDHATPQPSFDQPSQALITPAHCLDHAPAKHPRPTNTNPPRSQPTPPSSPIHLSDRQPCIDELQS